MKLSKIVFLGGLSSLALSSIIFWQRSNAVPVRQTYQVAATIQPTPIAPSPTAPALAASVQSVTPVAPAPTSPATPVAPAVPTASFPSVAQANLRTIAPALRAVAQRQAIATCKGLPGNANFRSIPSLDPGAVLGVVAQGEVVALTGRTAIGDGGFWYEAIVPNPLFPSSRAGAQNQLAANQVGWIAGCFVGE